MDVVFAAWWLAFLTYCVVFWLAIIRLVEWLA